MSGIPTWLRFIICLALALPAAFSSARAEEQKTLLILGDSLTAGFGLEDPDTQAYPARLQAHVDEAGLPWRVVGAGLSGETSAGGLRRIDWVLRQRVDIFVLALGGNDGLRGIAPSTTLENLKAILVRVKARFPQAQLFVAGMQMPANMGEDYAKTYRATFPKAAQEGGATLIPFLLEGVGGITDLNQADGIHPNRAGHQVIADRLWPLLQASLKNQVLR